MLLAANESDKDFFLSGIRLMRIWSSINLECSNIHDIRRDVFPSLPPVIRGIDTYGKKYMIFQVTCGVIALPHESGEREVGSVAAYFDGISWSLREDFEAGGYGIFRNRFGRPDPEKLVALARGEKIKFKNITVQLAQTNGAINDRQEV